MFQLPSHEYVCKTAFIITSGCASQYPEAPPMLRMKNTGNGGNKKTASEILLSTAH